MIATLDLDEEDEADVAELINLPSTVSESSAEEENSAKVLFEADPRRTCAVVGDSSPSETFRPNEVRAWATSNKSSLWAFAFASEALVPAFAAPEPVPVPTVAFSQVDISGQQLDVCATWRWTEMMNDVSYAGAGITTIVFRAKGGGGGRTNMCVG